MQLLADYFKIPLAWMLGSNACNIYSSSIMGVKVAMPKLALSGILIILGLTYWKLH